MKSVFNRLSIGLATAVIVLAQVVMPVQAAYADDNNGTYQPVWCHLTGNSWKAQLGNENSGDRHDAFALLMTQSIKDLDFDNIDNTIANGVQVKAHDRSDKLDAECGTQSVATTPTYVAVATCDVLDSITWNYDSTKLTISPLTPVYDANKMISATFTPIAPYTLKDAQGNVTTSLTLSYADVQPNDCTPATPKDATAAVKITDASCTANGSVSLNIAATMNATLVGNLDQTPGTHIATFTATANHLFENGTTTFTVEYTVPAQLDGEQCETPATECTLPNQTFTSPWMHDGGEPYYGEETYPFAGAWPEPGTPATATFTDKGLYLTTPANDSYTMGFMDAGNTPLKDIGKMSYKTMRDSSSTPYTNGFNQTLPAYVIRVDIDGNLATTNDRKFFFYEPYNNMTVTEDMWITPNLTGSALWYVQGTDQLKKPWSQLVTENPNAVAVFYGFNQGQSNPGTNAYIAYMEFDCATTAFVAGSGSTDVPEVPETPVVPTTPVIPGKGSIVAPAVTELPETGAGSNALLIGLLASAAAYGAVYFAQPKRRYE